MTTAPTTAWIPGDSFGRRLIWLRHELKLTQRQAAELCQLDDGSWSNWENGSSPRDLAKVARKIQAATGVDIGWLVFGSVPPTQGERDSWCNPDGANVIQMSDRLQVERPLLHAVGM